MSVRLLQVVAVILVLAAIAFAAMEIMYIGQVFEDKSLYSYMLKTGDLDAGSPAALAHIQGSAGYGRTVAIRAAVGASVFGFMAGILIAQWLRRRHAA